LDLGTVAKTVIDTAVAEIGIVTAAKTRNEVVAQNLDPHPKTARNVPAPEVLVIGSEAIKIKTGKDLDPRSGAVATAPDPRRTGNLATPIPTRVVAVDREPSPPPVLSAQESSNVRNSISEEESGEI